MPAATSSLQACGIRQSDRTISPVCQAPHPIDARPQVASERRGYPLSGIDMTHMMRKRQPTYAYKSQPADRRAVPYPRCLTDRAEMAVDYPISKCAAERV